MNTITEPAEAFPYKAPTDEIWQQYSHIFELSEPLPPRFFKVLFDKLVVVVMLVVSAPVLLLLKLAFLIEGWLLGLGRINKGTDEMGKPVYEYEYVDHYLKRSSFGMLLDLWIIWTGVLVIVKGGGH